MNAAVVLRSIVTGYRMDDELSVSHYRVKNFLFSMSYRLALGPTRPPSQ